MAHYIDKDAVVAEIEKLYNGEIDTYTRNILDRLKSNIDTIEVEDVDLDLEITLWANAIPEIQLDDIERFAKDIRYKENVEIKKADSDENEDKILKKDNWDYDELDFYAQHFFELGG